MKAKTFSDQYRAQRKKRLLFAIGMLLLLLAATSFLVFSRHYLRQSQIEATVSQGMYQEAVWMEEEAQNVALLNEKAQRLLQLSTSHSLSPDYWAERRINLKQAQASRGEANDLLLSIARTKKRLFSVEEFDISVMRDDEGLFNISDRPNMPLLLTVRGTALFRTER
ncbi:MAG: hypothetical protein LBS40_07160 [Burkholderiales bacterium]|nr:hypothetical protein [Burkholderiales bacterium]